MLGEAVKVGDQGRFVILLANAVLFIKEPWEQAGFLRQLRKTAQIEVDEFFLTAPPAILQIGPDERLPGRDAQPVSRRRQKLAQVDRLCLLAGAFEAVQQILE